MNGYVSNNMCQTFDTTHILNVGSQTCQGCKCNLLLILLNIHIFDILLRPKCMIK